MANPTAVFLSKSQSQQSVDRRLHGLTLYLARGTYFVVALTILVLSILGIPGYIADLVGQHNIARVTLSMMLTVGVIIVSLFIFLRRSDDWLVLFFALTIVSTGSWERTMHFGARSIGLWPLYRFFDGIGSILIIFLYFMFPNGVFVPGWTRKFSGFVVGWRILGFLLYLIPEAMPWWPRNPDGFDLTSAGWLLLSGIGAYAQIYRFSTFRIPLNDSRSSGSSLVFLLQS